jgi:glucose/arabinose dehydrogenase
MRFRTIAGLTLLVAIVAVAGLALRGGEHATLPVTAGIGPNPQLPPPVPGLFPTVKIAPVEGWKNGAHPIPAAGLAVSALATGFDHPRNLLVLPNGDILVCETNGPARPGDSTGLKGWIANQIMTYAGATTSSPNRIILLRPDSKGAVTRFVFLTGLTSPYGMALIGTDFYVANTDNLMRYSYTQGATSITTPGVLVTDLPGGPIDHHWTKNLVASADGSTLFVSIGSNSNVGENGMAAEAGRAAIWRVAPKTGAHSIYASGLRNPNGLAIDPADNALWTSVNERDEIGSDLVPDYMTHVTQGGFYGWPYSYYGQHVDARVTPPRPDLVAKAIMPDYALGPHTASLGLGFSRSDAQLPMLYANGVFVGQHGSWNRNPPSGYKVIFVPFKDGQPSGMPLDVLTGFLDEDGRAQGRPVAVALDKEGALLVADDVGNTVWKVTSSAGQ